MKQSAPILRFCDGDIHVERRCENWIHTVDFQLFAHSDSKQPGNFALLFFYCCDYGQIERAKTGRHARSSNAEIIGESETYFAPDARRVGGLLAIALRFRSAAYDQPMKPLWKEARLFQIT